MSKEFIWTDELVQKYAVTRLGNTMQDIGYFKEQVLKEPERIEVTTLTLIPEYPDKNSGRYFFNSTNKISEDKFPAIKQAIEAVLNDEPRVVAVSEFNDAWEVEIANLSPKDIVRINGRKYVAAAPVDTVVKDWEVIKLEHKGAISFWSTGRGYTLEEIQKDGFNIYSVCRLSDGEVFTIGDEIKFHSGVNDGAIEKFEIDAFDNTKISARRSYAGVVFPRWEKVTKIFNDVPKRFTQQELDKAIEDAFAAAREGGGPDIAKTIATAPGGFYSWTTRDWLYKYSSAVDYLNTLKK